MSECVFPKAPVGDEWFDVVDERNTVVRQELRSIVHREGLLHRAIHLFVFNQAGEVFLQKRSMSKDVAPGLWDSSTSGHLDAGEGYGAAVVRETREEIGIELSSVPTEVLRVDACRETGNEFVSASQAESEGPFILHPEEIERGEWFELGRLETTLQAQEPEFAPSFVYLWRRCSDPK